MKTLNGARIAVAGAGALGSAIALRLAEAGRAVTVFDAAPNRANASAVAAGMLAPVSEALFDPVSRDHLMLMRRARDLWPDYADRLGIRLSRTGARLEGSDAWRAEIGGRMERLGLAASDRIDEDWRLEARPALATLKAAAAEAGAVFLEGEVTAFQPGEVTLADGRRQAFEVLVLATGPGVRGGRIAPETSALEPIKGQILRAPAPDQTAAVIRGEGVYLAPGETLAVGATMEMGRDDLIPDPSATQALRRAALALRPTLALDAASAEVGVRATTPDGLPLVGWSRSPGVMLAVGARRNGWLFAPLVADMVSAYLTNDNLGPDAAALDARRFEKV